MCTPNMPVGTRPIDKMKACKPPRKIVTHLGYHSLPESILKKSKVLFYLSLHIRVRVHWSLWYAVVDTSLGAKLIAFKNKSETRIEAFKKRWHKCMCTLVFCHWLKPNRARVSTQSCPMHSFRRGLRGRLDTMQQETKVGQKPQYLETTALELYDDPWNSSRLPVWSKFWNFPLAMPSASQWTTANLFESCCFFRCW